MRPCVGQDSLSAAYGGVSRTSRLVGDHPALGLGCGVDDLQDARTLDIETRAHHAHTAAIKAPGGRQRPQPPG